MRFDIITIFPSVFDSLLETSILKRAQDIGIVEVNAINPRDFTSDRHRTVDDRPYGGGAGMVMKPEPLFDAVESVRSPESHVVLLTPQGRKFCQSTARALSKIEHVVLICGHYEGVDERVRTDLIDDEISIGDYILTNGNLAAMVVVDAVTRLLPGALGSEASVLEESFSGDLLEYPQFTRPQDYRGMSVPPILLTGNHEQIKQWRYEQSVKRTKERRPEL